MSFISTLTPIQDLYLILYKVRHKGREERLRERERERERKEGGEGERKRKEEKEGEGETGNNTERR